MMEDSNQEKDRSKEWVGVEKMAEILDLPVSFFYTPYRRKGPDAIPCLRVGKYLRYNPPTVIEFFVKKNRAE